MGTWSVEIRGTITRDIRWVQVEATSMGEALEKAVAQHPTYRAKAIRSASHLGSSSDADRIALARIVAVAHGIEALTEGQLATTLAMDRVQIRELIDDGRAHIQANPIPGENGKNIMKMLGLS